MVVEPEVDRIDDSNLDACEDMYLNNDSEEEEDDGPPPLLDFVKLGDLEIAPQYSQTEARGLPCHLTLCGISGLPR